MRHFVHDHLFTLIYAPACALITLIVHSCLEMRGR